MSTKLTRRNFLEVAAAAGALGLAACAQQQPAAPAAEPSAAEPSAAEPSAAEPSAAAGKGDLTAPAADAYPIDPDGTEHLGAMEETRDGWTKITNPGTDVELGVMDTAKVIIVDGLAFKDLNGNGKLDLYEDWRQDGPTRAAALAEMMTPEEIIPLRFHGGVSDNQTSTDTESFGLIEQGSVSGVSRLSYNLDSFASDVQWINNVQSTAEGTKYGIPYINSRDPAQLYNVPSSVGLAAAFDKDVWRKAGMWQARVWRAMGITCELGPQIDLYTQIRGTRLNGSVGNDPALNRDFAAAFGGGMQSTWGDDEATDDQGWGKDSVGVMLKHFVGEGSNEGGRDDHSDSGKWDVFPGGNFKAHLVPFLDGGLHLDSKTEQMAAVMPCYGIAYDPNDPEGLGEHVGAGFSSYLLSGLRNTGWDGMITTDWMISSGTGHGVDNLDGAQRLQKMYGASVDQHGGSFELENGATALQAAIEELGEDGAAENYRTSARRIFEFMHKVQLFDNPYSDRSRAKELLESEAAAAFGMDAATKSIIMLKNKDNVISKDGLSGKVYVPMKFYPASQSFFGSSPARIATMMTLDGLTGAGLDVVTDTMGEPTGEPAEGSDEPTFTEADLTKLEDFTDVKYAIVKINNPADRYQGVEGGPSFMSIIMGTEPEPGPFWKPISLQYRPYKADGPNVRQTSLNPDADTDNRSYYGQETFATNEADLDAVIALKEALPADAKLILCIDADRPMCFGEIEPYADAILLGFGGITDQAYANIITGAAEPSGLLSHPMPKDMDAVEALNEDTPRSVEPYTDSEGNTYAFAFGLNYAGKIEDDRVATYGADPVLEPTTAWSPNA